MHIRKTETTAAAPDSGAPLLYELPLLYDAVVQPGPCEAFYREEARRAGGPVLELACGTGRLAIPLAADGREVVGLDASDRMLAAARRKAAAAGASVSWVRGDMARFALGRSFALIIISCNSLAHLTTTAELQSCFRAVLRHLAPRGKLVFDVVQPDVAALARPEGGWVRLDTGPNPSSAIEAMERGTYDPVTQIRTTTWRIRDAEAGERALRPFRLRQFFPQELPLLLGASGLRLVARHGDFARNPLTAASLNQICVARAQ